MPVPVPVLLLLLRRCGAALTRRWGWVMRAPVARTGLMCNPHEALAVGYVDAVLPAADLLDACTASAVLRG